MVPPVKEKSETLDRDWVEQPAFAEVPAMAGPSAGTQADQGRG